MEVQLVRDGIARLSGLVMFNIKVNDTLRSELYVVGDTPYTRTNGEVIPIYDGRYNDFKVAYSHSVCDDEETGEEGYHDLDITPASKKEIRSCSQCCKYCGCILKGEPHEVNSCCTYSHFKRLKGETR